MSISNPDNKLEQRVVLDLQNSDYEFSRFDKAELSDHIRVLMLMVAANSYSNWAEAASPILEAVYERFPPGFDEIYCFVMSPLWKKSTQIVRYFGLGKSLTKELGVGTLDFQFEKELEVEGDIAFYGIVKLNHDNARALFSLISANENGVLFACPESRASCCTEIVAALEPLLGEKTKSQVHRLNIVRAIESIVGRGVPAIFPYAWEETGDYHLDIFERST